MNTGFTNININLLKLFVTSEPTCTFLFTNNIAIRQVFAEKSSLSFFWYLIPSPLKRKNCWQMPFEAMSQAAFWSVRTKTAQNTVFPWIILAGVIISFFPSKVGYYSREAFISNVAHWKSYPKYFVLLSHYIKKLSHQINCMNMGLLSVPNLVPWDCNFQSLNHHWSVLLDHWFHFNLTGRG